MTLKYNTAIVHFIQVSQNQPLFPKSYKFFIPAKLKSSLSVGDVALVQNNLDGKKYLAPVVITGNLTKMNSKKEFKSLSRTTGQTLEQFLNQFANGAQESLKDAIQADQKK